jgi:putative phage-type endonuclease
MLTQKQIEQRRQGVGGSDIAAICGLSKWATPLDIFLEKIGEKESQSTNESMRWGNILEAVVAKEFERVKGFEVYEPTEALVHPEFSFMRANIDRLIKDQDAILECKTAKFDQGWGESGTDEMPPAYLLQVAYYCAIANVSMAYVAVLIGGSDFRILEYKRNMELENKVLEIVKDFWNKHVVPKMPPQAKSMGDIISLFPQSHKEKIIVASEKTETLFYKLKDIKEALKPLEEEFEETKTQLCIEIGDAEILYDPANGKLATFKTQTAERLDTKKLKSENPEIFQNYVKISESRVFRMY